MKTWPLSSTPLKDSLKLDFEAFFKLAITTCRFYAGQLAKKHQVMPPGAFLLSKDKLIYVNGFKLESSTDFQRRVRSLATPAIERAILFTLLEAHTKDHMAMVVEVQSRTEKKRIILGQDPKQDNVEAGLDQVLFAVFKS